VRHVPEVALSEAGTPLVDDVFARAQATLDAPMLAYVNADIVLLQDFADAVARLAAGGEPILMVGRRTDLDFDDTLDFGGDWEPRLREDAAARGALHAESGIDYFVFRPGLWTDVPPFAIGRFAWDGWLLSAAHGSGAKIVDATRAVLAVHQNHAYPGQPTPVGDGLWHEEIRRNLALAGAIPASFTILDATHLMTRGGRIAPALTRRHVLRRLHRLRVPAA
jgi:hypothetical protein